MRGRLCDVSYVCALIDMASVGGCKPSIVLKSWWTLPPRNRFDRRVMFAKGATSYPMAVAGAYCLMTEAHKKDVASDLMMLSRAQPCL